MSAMIALVGLCMCWACRKIAWGSGLVRGAAQAAYTKEECCRANVSEARLLHVLGAPGGC